MTFFLYHVSTSCFPDSTVLVYSLNLTYVMGIIRYLWRRAIKRKLLLRVDTVPTSLQ